MKVEYKVITRNEVIFIGTPLEIEEKFGVNRKSIYSMAKYGTTYKRLRFERVQDLSELYAETKRLLLLYGNTNMKDDPTEIVKMLKDDGIEVAIEYYGKQNKKQSLSCCGVTSAKSWILTVKEVRQ